MNSQSDVKINYNNLVEMQEDACSKFSQNPIFGTKNGGAFEWITYAEFAEKVDQFRGGLANLGVGRDDKVAIISKNTVQWAVACYATFGLEAQFVPMYETQLPKDWEYISQDSGSKILLAADSEIYQHVKDFPEKIEKLESVVLLEGSGVDQTLTYESLLEKGKQQPIPSAKPDFESEMGMLYTSGTTGNPKGVLLTHHNILFMIAVGIQSLRLSPNDQTLSFLPWAHSFGQLAEVHLLIQSGYSTGLVADVNEIVSDMSLVKPTVFFAVPRVYNRIFDRLNGQISEKLQLIQNLFRAGLKHAKREREGETLSFMENLALSLARKIIFKKILDRFGGRLRLAVSGASALSAEVAEFVNDIGIGVYEGYGLSENSAALTMNLPGKRKFGSVGKPLPGIRIEIDSSVEGSKEEDGEVVAYGENIMKGYHNLPEQTSSTLTESRGLRTGDLGHLDEDGYLYITGRIKEQYKLENGKFVAPAPLEEELKLSPYITQAMIYGLNQEHNVALIVADMEKVRQFADEKGLSGSNPELLQLSEVRELFKKEVQQFSTTFKNFERIEDFSLLDEEWNPDNGLLTPTMKIKRSVIEEKFKENIESLYA